MANEAEGWGWWAGWDDEHYTVGPEDTRDAIIQAAVGENTGENDDGTRLVFHIVEAMQKPIQLSSVVDLSESVERWLDCNEEMHDEEGNTPFEKLTAAQWVEAENVMKAALDAWQAEQGHTFKPYYFNCARNHETVTVALADPA